VDKAYFVDLPGYGYAKVGHGERKRWDKLINSYFQQPRRDVLLVQLLDSRHAPSADDCMMLEYLQHHQIPFAVALTKADKLKKSQYEPTVQRFLEECAPFGCCGVVLTSADSGYGIDTLRALIDEAVQRDSDDQECEQTP
jgi:GTP-binding protein